MKTIGFIGAFEKMDLILYVAKLLTISGKKILIIDATMLQKTRYTVPAITPSKAYITTYENIDVAVGFRDLQSIISYEKGIENNHDILLIDIDSPKMFENFNLNSAEKLYYVTAFDNFSLKRGVEIIKNINLNEKLQMTKVMFESGIQNEYEEELNFMTENTQIKWDEEKLYFPYDQGDSTAMIENQRIATIKYRNLSEQYRESLIILAQGIEPEIKASDIRKSIKKL